MTHIALEGGCFVLSANQFCRRKDYPPPPDYDFTGLGEEPSPDTVVCPGGSVIISPSGEVLAGPNYEGEALITADLGKNAKSQYVFYCICVCSLCSNFVLSTYHSCFGASFDFLNFNSRVRSNVLMKFPVQILEKLSEPSLISMWWATTLDLRS
jgi:hypothetical protein